MGLFFSLRRAVSPTLLTTVSSAYMVLSTPAGHSFAHITRIGICRMNPAQSRMTSSVNANAKSLTPHARFAR